MGHCVAAQGLLGHGSIPTYSLFDIQSALCYLNITHHHTIEWGPIEPVLKLVLGCYVLLVIRLITAFN